MSAAIVRTFYARKIITIAKKNNTKEHFVLKDRGHCMTCLNLLKNVAV
jgi:hypothetical protein